VVLSPDHPCHDGAWSSIPFIDPTTLLSDSYLPTSTSYLVYALGATAVYLRYMTRMYQKNHLHALRPFSAWCHTPSYREPRRYRLCHRHQCRRTNGATCEEPSGKLKNDTRVWPVSLSSNKTEGLENIIWQRTVFCWLVHIILSRNLHIYNIIPPCISIRPTSLQQAHWSRAPLREYVFRIINIRFTCR